MLGENKTGTMRRLELTGQAFGRWTVLKFSHTDGQTWWYCKCQCGNTGYVVASNLTCGISKSCGCLVKKHGLYKHPLYQVWRGMIDRCTDSTLYTYYRYGGRGVTVCKAWLNTPTAFIRWSENNGYKIGLQLDRINNDGNYEPKNCRFVTCRVNNNNRRDNLIVIYHDKEYTLAELVQKFGVVPYKIAHQRIVRQNWDVVQACAIPSQPLGTNQYSII